MKKLKKPVSILLTLTMVVSLFTMIPVASAADEISLQWIFEAVMKEGSVDHDIKLLVDVKGNVEATVYSGSTFKIDLNGHTISSDGKSHRLFNVEKGGTLIITDSAGSGSIYGFSADNGGVVYNSGTAAITNCNFHDNEAKLSGGAVFNSGTLTVSGGSFSKNTAVKNDGGAIKNTGRLTVKNVTMEENRAVYGGAVHSNSSKTGNDRKTVLENVTFTNNNASKNGGALMLHTITDVTSCALSGNSAGNQGGAIAVSMSKEDDEVTVNGSRFTSNSAKDGGGIYTASSSAKHSLIFNDSALTGNTATNNGGAVMSNGTSAYKNVEITGNSAGGNGGGIFENSNILAVRDKIVITDNGDSNLYLKNGKRIRITSPFASGTEIGVTTENGRAVITENYQVFYRFASPSDFFSGDRGGGSSVFTVDGEEVLYNSSRLYIDRTWNVTDAETGKGSMTTAVKEVPSSAKTVSDLSDVRGVNLSDGWYYVEGSKTLNHCLDIKGNVHLVLCDGAELTCKGGVYLTENSNLTIYAQNNGSGKLNAPCGDSDCAGIGGREGTKTGGLVIKGGNITASGGKYGAGIGGGEDRGMTKPVTIYGGTVSASGGKYGAGIGGGEGGNQGSSVIIYGGTVTANGGAYAAGIGGGQEYHGGGDGGTVKIYGGTVEANGGQDGAGIGGGEDGSGGTYYQYGGSVEARGGKAVDLSTGGGAGVGGGEDGNQGGSVNVYGGRLYAHSGSFGGSAGIGGGGNDGSGGTVNISGGSVFADAEYGAGIGGSSDKSNGTINITGGTVEALSEYAAAIGAGYGETAQGGDITIENAKVTAKAKGYGAGIGAAGASNDAGSAKNITIKNSMVTAGSSIGAGIGGGGVEYGDDGGHGGNIVIEDSAVFAISKNRGAGIGGGNGGDGGSVTIKNSYIEAVGGSANYDYIAEGRAKVKKLFKSYYADFSGSAYARSPLAGFAAEWDGKVADVVIALILNNEWGGAGIGGGSNGRGANVTIDGKSIVVAAGGRNGTTAIGHGLSNSENRSLTIPGDYEVLAGSDNSNLQRVSYESRVSSCRDNTYAIVEPCGHEGVLCTAVNSNKHKKTCTYCNTSLGEYAHDYRYRYVLVGQDHVYRGICDECGYEDEAVSYIFKQKSQNIYVSAIKGNEYTVPEFTEFGSAWSYVCWEAPDGKLYYPGDKLTAVNDEMTFKAVWLDVVDTKYIDAEGNEQTVRARILKDPSKIKYLKEGWYVAGNDITFNSQIEFDGDINLIAADGKTITFGGGINYTTESFNNSSATVYGQAAQSGVIACRGTITVGSFTQHGGVFTSENVSFYGGLEISGGRFDVTKTLLILSLSASNSRDFNFIGGTVNVSNLYLMGIRPLTLAWKDLSDSITLSKQSGKFQSAEIAIGQAFTDGENIYTGTLSEAQQSAIIGKTLTPYELHHYGEPVWSWSNDHSSATVTFECTDSGCSESFTLDADVTVEDTDYHTLYTASARFNNKTYTDTYEYLKKRRVILEQGGNGTLKSDKSYAELGSEVAVWAENVTAGWCLQTVTVTDASGNDIPVEFNTFDCKFRFKMPASDVTVTPKYINFTYVPEDPPYVEGGKYILGYREHYVGSDGKLYEITETRDPGNLIANLTRTVSYFEYQYYDDYPRSSEKYFIITAYTGPKNISELIIPERIDYRGFYYPVAELGNGWSNIISDSQTPFTVNLPSTVTKINARAFQNTALEKLTGHNVSTVGHNAFNNVNSQNGNKLDLTLDVQSTISFGDNCLYNDDVVLHVSHFTTLVNEPTGAKKLVYDLNDEHTYYDVHPEWEWAEDFSSVTANFTCSHKLCDYTKTLDATVTQIPAEDKLTIKASVHHQIYEYYSEDYSDERVFTRVARVEPSIDENGEYILGSVEYYERDGKRYAVNEDGTLGAPIDSIEFSYFDFELSSDGTAYIITHYTGPTENLSEIVIPKTYRGRRVIGLGDSDETDIEKSRFITEINFNQFKLTLSENIESIAPNAFRNALVTEVGGDTSGLREIGDYAFAFVNVTEDYAIVFEIDSLGPVDFADSAFFGDNVTLRLQHNTVINGAGSKNFGAKSLTYEFTDAHSYGEPVWNWSDDCTEAEVTFECSGSLCGQKETVKATVADNSTDTMYRYTATAEFNGETYTDTKAFMKSLGIYVGGVQVTLENRNDVLGDGTVSYNYGTNTLTLNNADIEAGKVKSTECGISYNLDEPLNIVLIGTNRIVNETVTAGTSSTFGIRLWGDYEGVTHTISGGGSLSISLNANGAGGHYAYYGIYNSSSGSLTLDNADVNISISGNDMSRDIYTGNTLKLTNTARLSAYTQSSYSGTESVFCKYLTVDDECFFETASRSIALRVTDPDGIRESGALVNTEPQLLGAEEWDGDTALNSYKYVLAPINADYAAIEIAETKFGTVTADKATAFKGDTVTLTASPDEGAQFYAWNVTDINGEEVALNGNIFTMPSGYVTVTGLFKKHFEGSDPYIDSDGEYHTGVIEHYAIGDKLYAVNEDGSVGDELNDVTLCDFDFKDLGDAYQILHYTGSYDGLDELVIPKSYNGKSVTVIGDGANKAGFMQATGDKKQFVLKLNKNITEIKPYAFYTIWVTEVKGDTSNLSKIGNYAFSWANSPGGYATDITLDYPGTITVGNEIFNHMHITAHIRHATKFSKTSFSQQSISYIFTDAHTYSEPVWTWADDKTSATATFTCTDARCGHAETVDAVIEKTVDGDMATYVATVEVYGETYTDTKTGYADDIGTRLLGHSLSLDGDIGVNFYMELSNSIANSETAYMHFTIPAGDITTQTDVRVADAKKVTSGGKTYYVFKCQVAAKEMTSEIMAQIIDGTREGTIYTYSVREYADYLLAHTADNAEYAKAAPLVKAMLNYGATSQLNFDKNPETLANSGLTDAEKELGDISIDIADPVINNLSEGTTFEGASLSLKSETTLSLFFKSSETLTFSCDGYDVETVQSGGYQIARIRGIKAKRIGDILTLHVNGGTVQYSPLNYCKNVLNPAGSTPDEAQAQDGKLVNAVKALYLYWQAANSYFD